MRGVYDTPPFAKYTNVGKPPTKSAPSGKPDIRTLRADAELVGNKNDLGPFGHYGFATPRFRYAICLGGYVLIIGPFVLTRTYIAQRRGLMLRVSGPSPYPHMKHGTSVLVTNFFTHRQTTKNITKEGGLWIDIISMGISESGRMGPTPVYASIRAFFYKL